MLMKGKIMPLGKLMPCTETWRKAKVSMITTRLRFTFLNGFLNLLDCSNILRLTFQCNVITVFDIHL